MKKLFLLVTLLSFGILTYSQPAKGKLIPVTTKSKSGLSLYNQGMKYFNDVHLDKAIEAFNEALKQDQDFFMVNYQLALYYLLNMDIDNFGGYSDAAINCKTKLSDAEELLKDALVKLKKGNNNVTDLGKELLEMYPGDPNSYNNMVSFQTLAGDSTGIVETLNRAIKTTANPASFYNQLGYAYLTLKKNDKAEEAFDKYIELDPKNPNVYDSKGDFYMSVEKYDKAYESYMKAYSIDPSFSYDKARMARQLYEKETGRKLEIVPI
jgi:Tfp pilus assembly protein PilF